VKNREGGREKEMPVRWINKKDGKATGRKRGKNIKT
jgi:hypothetical protein